MEGMAAGSPQMLLPLARLGGSKQRNQRLGGGGQPEMLEGSAGVTQMSLDSGGTASSLPGVRAVSS